jgi:L-ascorbate metabolism protein UlaG (beta-lactamase superfamily)
MFMCEFHVTKKSNFKQMKLTYIYHSCFAIEGDDWTIIIDFYKDTEGSIHHGYVNDVLLNRTGRLYVLSSHAHIDHFNKQILTWKAQHQDTIYVLSKDILDRGKAKPAEAHFIDKLESYEDELVKITAFGSTDIGISFLIEVEGKRIFHAGDLNNWHWKDESTPEEVAESERFFLSELSVISENITHLDVAMFPVDRRLGTDYMRGAEQFLTAIQVDKFSPMHFGKYYESAAAIQSFAESKGGSIIKWSHKGESVEI